MRAEGANSSGFWARMGPQLLPFAETSRGGLSLDRLLRLSLFQISVGMSLVLLVGTLNRVMIVELDVPAALVATMIALPVLFAPLRALVGFRSDGHRSAFGWRRVPYVWLGSLMQFSGLAIMPFALIVLSGDSSAPVWVGPVSAGLAFLLVGAGLHTVQTAGLALATDLCPVDSAPRVVAWLSVVLLLGMLLSALVFGALLADFSQIRLIQVVQGAAVVVMGLNMVAIWKQEPRDRLRAARRQDSVAFFAAWERLRRAGPWDRRLATAALGTAAFGMQDVMLEPYGGQILGLSVARTTALTALMAGAGIIGFLLAARWLGRAADPHRVAALGALGGIAAFVAIIAAASLHSSILFAVGVIVVGAGAGVFAHATLTACMQAAPADGVGLALGAWGAVQATAAGIAVAAGGVLHDLIGVLAETGALGPALSGPIVGFGAVYLVEIMLLFVTLAVMGPLVGSQSAGSARFVKPLF
jgi:BCD family chlorophyll transporter-like MFS transporter